MKKAISMGFAGAAALALSACGGNAEPAADEAAAPAEEATMPEAGHDMTEGASEEMSGGEEVQFEGEAPTGGNTGTDNPSGPVTAPASE